MFSTQHWQIKLVYMGFGGLLMLVGMLISPVTAKRDTFDTIQCSKLEIIDEEGISRILLATGDRLDVVTVGNEVVIGYDSNGPYITASNSDFEKSGAVWLTIGEYGGRVSTFQYGGVTAVVGSSNLEHGRVVAYGNGGKIEAMLGSTEHGGRVTVFGNGVSHGQAAIGIDENGNGVVSTWDRHGNLNDTPTGSHLEFKHPFDLDR